MSIDTETAELDEMGFPSAPIESEPEKLRQRRNNDYDPTTVRRPPTRSEAFADEDGLFDIFDEEKPSLQDMYIDVATLNKLKATNGLKSISTFSGGGGSVTGFAWAGWNELASVEFVESARETLALNYTSTSISPVQVKEIVKELEAAGLPFTVSYFKDKTVKGKKIIGGVDWESTIADAWEKEVFSAFTQFRSEATTQTLERFTEPGKMVLWGDDVRSLDGVALIRFLGIEPGELDCFEGSPPCKSFSMAGLREDGWGRKLKYSDERDQRTDDLFDEYIRLLRDIRPKSFIAENVAGILMGTAIEQTVNPMIKEFEELGYNVSVLGMNSANYGVPQSRPRAIFQGIRTDQRDKRGRSILPTWPDRNPHEYTCQDALDAAGPNDEEALKFANLEKYEIGKMWKELKHGSAPSNKAYQLIRCHPKRPVPTIAATSAGNTAAAGPTHPHECRKFTINEYRWLFSFPTDYRFAGNIEQQGERMGRSVTPYMMKQIAETLAKNLKKAV